MYAIVLANVEELDSKADHSAEIVKHLEKAVELDADDAYTVHMLGVAHYKKKNYAEALSCFQKAENIRARALAKTMLLKLKVKREDYVEEEY
ncbi:unnamed protein product [Haemonchus placei]|uniref:TPR_REGION domain-containing protein n=1 Tax=Haemonchus placei TaxID=6290 RepID=A0A158QKP4_HAEPC|nr:unnamed protein product [Haemonchus placei]